MTHLLQYSKPSKSAALHNHKMYEDTTKSCNNSRRVVCTFAIHFEATGKVNLGLDFGK